MEGTSYWTVRLVLSPISPSTTNDLQVSIATSLHQSLPDFVPFSDMVHRLLVVQTQTHAETHTHKENKNKLFTLGDGPGPASPPRWKLRSRIAAPTRATAEPGQPRPFSSCRRTCLVSFDLLSGHGSGSNLSVTASEINSQNPGICICNQKLICQIKCSVCNDFREHGNRTRSRENVPGSPTVWCAFWPDAPLSQAHKVLVP